MSESDKMPTQVYFDDSGTPCLESSVIVVVDILGYRNMTRKAFQNGEEQALLIRIYDALNKSVNNLKDKSGVKWYTKPFSDNLISAFKFFGSDNDPFSINMACSLIGEFQMDMLTKGFFVRGGISIAEIHISENLIFGRVMEELLKAEELAKYPRIVFLESAMSHLKKFPELQNQLLQENILWNEKNHDVKFVNYLLPMMYSRDSNREKIMNNHKWQIETNLEEFRFQPENQGIYEKYIWSAQYHNRLCENSKYFNSEHFKISIDKFTTR